MRKEILIGGSIMEKEKIVQFNRESASMLWVIQSYITEKSGSVSDTDVILRAIEKQYEKISSELNENFREQMANKLLSRELSGDSDITVCRQTGDEEEGDVRIGTDTSIDIFHQAADLLEALSVFEGSTLESEFANFLAANIEGIPIFTCYDKEKVYVTGRYIRIFKILSRRYEADVLDCVLDEINTVYSIDDIQ